MLTYYAYIMASVSRTLYVGVTNNLERCVYEHQQGSVPGFTSRYGVDRLVWYESFRDVRDAIACEKRIKGWTRAKKVALVEERNPGWQDLSVKKPAQGAEALGEEPFGGRSFAALRMTRLGGL